MSSGARVLPQALLGPAPSPPHRNLPWRRPLGLTSAQAHCPGDPAHPRSLPAFQTPGTGTRTGTGTGVLGWLLPEYFPSRVRRREEGCWALLFFWVFFFFSETGSCYTVQAASPPHFYTMCLQFCCFTLSKGQSPTCGDSGRAGRAQGDAASPGFQTKGGARPTVAGEAPEPLAA